MSPSDKTIVGGVTFTAAEVADALARMRPDHLAWILERASMRLPVHLSGAGAGLRASARDLCALASDDDDTRVVTVGPGAIVLEEIEETPTLPITFTGPAPAADPQRMMTPNGIETLPRRRKTTVV